MTMTRRFAEDVQLEARMAGLNSLIVQHKPDFILLQEVCYDAAAAPPCGWMLDLQNLGPSLHEHKSFFQLPGHLAVLLGAPFA